MVYLFLADGFEEIEAITPIDYLRRCGIELITVGVTGKLVTSVRGVIVQADVLVSEITYSYGVEMIILPGGGNGMNNLKSSKPVEEFILKAHQDNKYIAAICASPAILGGLGLLKGIEATCFKGFEKELLEANVSDWPVCHQKNIITAKSAGFSEEFSFKLIELLKGKKAVETLKSAIMSM